MKAEQWRESDLGPDGGFDAENPHDVKILDDLILTNIMAERAQKALHILCRQHSDPMRPTLLRFGTVSEYSEEERLLAYYCQRLLARKTKALRKAMPYLRGAIELSRYRQRLVQQYRECQEREPAPVTASA